MGTRILYSRLSTDKSLEEVRETVREALTLVGGAVSETPSGLDVRNGKVGVNLAYGADISAGIDLRDRGEGKWDVEAIINWRPNAVFWICLLIGLFLVVPWLVNVLYLFVDPTQAYQQALNRAQMLIE